MGCRRRPRHLFPPTASLCGMDTKNRAFLERVRVTNLSRDGVLIENVESAVRVGDLVTLRCEETTRRFRVIWKQCVGEGRQIGLTGIGPVPTIADTCWLPAAAEDEYVNPRVTIGRESSRYECEVALDMR